MPLTDPKEFFRTMPLKMRHDQFFKETFSDLPRAREFFQHTLPPDVALTAKWETLELIPNSFVGPDLADSEADLLYLVKLASDTPGGAEASQSAVYLYVLFEHQSTIDRDMPFRLLKYIINVWEAQEKGKMHLFPVLPVIFHQEASPWTAPRGIWDWLCLKNKGLSELKFLRPWVPDFKHLVLEASEMGSLARQFSTLLGLAVSLMKAAAEDRELEWWDEWKEQLGETVQGDERTLRAFFALVNYLFSTIPENQYSTIVEKMERLEDGKLKGLDMRSVADVFIEQGEIKGKLEGKLIGTIRTLQMVLNLESTPEEDLEKLGIGELEKLARELTTQLHKPA